MPTLGAPLDFSKYEGKQFRAHQLGAAPSSPVTGQMYYNSGDNTLYWWDGTQWVSARGGVSSVPDASTSVKGLVQLTGDLAGTATNPQIAAGVITDADVNAANKDGTTGTPSMRTLGSGATQAAAGNDPRLSDQRTPLDNSVTSAKIVDGTITDTDVASANKDGAAATPGLRTLGNQSYQAMPGNQTLDAIRPPGSPVDMAGYRITSVGNPTGANDAANKLYVDNNVQGLDAKASVKAATTGSITLSGTQTVDGIALGVNDRCLVKNQSSAPQNGLYSVQSGAWTRTTDADSWAELVSAFVFVEQGTQQDNGYTCTVDQGGTLDTTAVTWVQFSGAGQVISGAGLTKTGNTLDIGAGAGIQVNADDIQVAPNGITNAMIADGAINLGSADVTGTLPIGQGGTGSTTAAGSRTSLGTAGYYNNNATHSAGTTITITQTTHGLRASRAIMVQVQDNATGAVEIPDISVAANGDVTITYGASVSANTKLVTLVG